MSLEINKVARLVAIVGLEKMIEAHFQQSGQRGVGRDVAADSRISLVLVVHHGHRVPPHQAFDTALQRAVPRVRRLFLHWDRVGIGRVELHRHFDACCSRPLRERLDQASPLMRTFLVYDLVESLDPFCNFVELRF